MFPHTRNPFDTRPPGNPDTAGFLNALGDPQAAEAYRKAMGEEGDSPTTDTPASELTPEELARLHAIQDRERGPVLIEMRRREYLEWAEEFGLGGNFPQVWLDRIFTFNPDGTAEIKGNLNLSSRVLTRLPRNLMRANGDLTISGNPLTTLDDLPDVVNGTLTLSHNQLSTLDGLPKEIHGSLNLSHNRLTTLVGLPDVVNGALTLSHNQLSTLDGLPKEIHGSLDLAHNRLTTLVGLKGRRIGGALFLHEIPATNIPEGIGLGGEVVVRRSQTALAANAKARGYTIIIER